MRYKVDEHVSTLAGFGGISQRHYKHLQYSVCVFNWLAGGVLSAARIESASNLRIANKKLKRMLSGGVGP